MERLGNKLGWKKNEWGNFSAVCLSHDGYYKGADDYILCNQFFYSLQCMFVVILSVSERSFNCFLIVLQQYFFREEKCDSERICVRCRRQLRY